MKTLVIYDNDGHIYVQVSGSYILPQGGLQFMETEIPEGQILKGVNINVTPHTPIYEDIPIPEIQIVKKQLQDTQDILAEYIDSKYNALLNY